MDIACNKCGMEYNLDDTLISTSGTLVRCMKCNQVFKVYKPTLSKNGHDEWLLRQVHGPFLTISSLSILQQWIREGKISKDDLLSQKNGPWKRVGDIEQLKALFSSVAASPVSVSVNRSVSAKDEKDEWLVINQNIGRIRVIDNLNMLEQRIREGKISGTDLLSQKVEGMPWRKAEDIEQLKVFFLKAENSPPTDIKNTANSIDGNGDWLLFCASGSNQTIGSLSVLQQWIREGKISKYDSVTKKGMSWKKVGDIEQLKALFSSVAASPVSVSVNRSVSAKDEKDEWLVINQNIGRVRVIDNLNALEQRIREGKVSGTDLLSQRVEGMPWRKAEDIEQLKVLFKKKAEENLLPAIVGAQQKKSEPRKTLGRHSGKIVNDRYKLFELIDEGGMGAVYYSQDIRLGRRAAVKFLNAELTASDAAVKRFYREGQAASAVNHPNIISMFDVGVSEWGEPFLVMEYLSGENLGTILKRSKRMDSATALGIMEPALRGLSAAHDQNIVHRDLKPENIFVVRIKDGPPIVKLIDFGIAKVVETNEPHLTKTGAMLGTPSYMSPEQARGKGNFDHRADLYSMGVILYLILTGEHPFVGESYNDLIINILTEPPRDPLSINPDFPRDILPIIEKLLEKEPDKRYSDCKSLLIAFEMLDEFDYRTDALFELAEDMGPERFSSENFEMQVKPHDPEGPGSDNTSPAEPIKPSPPNPGRGKSPNQELENPDDENPSKKKVQPNSDEEHSCWSWGNNPDQIPQSQAQQSTFISSIEIMKSWRR